MFTAMEFRPNDSSITSETAPLIEPVGSESDTDLFMVPLKRPSRRNAPSRYRNVKLRSPPRSPLRSPPPVPRARSPKKTNPFRSPGVSGTATKTQTPPMDASPLMSPESSSVQHRPNSNASPNPQDSAGNHTMANPGSLAYQSPAMSGRATKAGSSAVIMSPETGTGSSRHSPQPDSRADFSTCKDSPSTKASSVYDTPQIITPDGHKADSEEAKLNQQQPPEIPPLSAARTLRNNHNNNDLSQFQSRAQKQVENLGLALQLQTIEPSLLSVPQAQPSAKWTVPDSPRERLSQLRATPDSAYDRARQMEVRRSEWKRAVYRFPVTGKSHWIIDVDLTESSHARLADVARRSSEGFEWNGDYELANIYNVLAVAHAKLVEEMRDERRLMAHKR